MRASHRRTALVLTMTLILTSFPLTDRPVNAGVLSETCTDDILSDSINVSDETVLSDEYNDEYTGLTDPVKATDDTGSTSYVEGDVIVCMSTGGDHLSSDGGEVTNEMAGDLASLLDSAEDLMDVTKAVNESEEFITEEDAPAEDGSLNEMSAPPEEYVLKYIHSDIYTTQELIDIFEADPHVLFAEPNYVYQLTDDINSSDNEESLIVNDDIAITEESTDISESRPEIVDITAEGSGDVEPDLTKYQYAYTEGAGGIDVPYWNTEGYHNAEGTVVAVMDSGVDYNHKDLKSVMWDDGLLYPELTALGGGMYGYNAADKNSKNVPYLSYDPMDDNGHGTHCSGSVGAPWNGYGVSGTANGTKIMAVKASNELGQFPTSFALRGFNYIKTAKEAGINIVAVNNSWGGSFDNNAALLATQELALLNVVCCFASANNKSNIDLIPHTATNLRENDAMIVVNANDKKENKSSFSNYGVRSCDVSAPGTWIMSTYPTGTGTPNPIECEPLKDKNGAQAMDDFAKDTTYFTYGLLNGAQKEVTEDEGNKVLKISSMKHFEPILTVSGNSLAGNPRSLAISARYGEDNMIALLIDVRLKDGSYKRCNPPGNLTDDYDYFCTYTLPDDMDIDDPEFRILAFFDDAQPSKSDLYIRRISFTDETSSYIAEDGTSMATPAVTGEVAVLAAKWPHDSAGRRVARVIGSTIHKDSLNNTSRTDGIVNVRKALDCDYAPVVNKAWMDEEGSLNVSGYFFGKDTGSVSVAYRGVDISGLTVTKWTGLGEDAWKADGKNGEDIITINPGTSGITTDEVKITVTTPKGKSGSRWMTVDNEDDSSTNTVFYSRLGVPGPEDAKLRREFMESYLWSGAALDGSIYYSGYISNEKEPDFVTWKYTLSDNGTESGWTKLNKPLHNFTLSNICAYDGMLLYADFEDWNIKMYSPDEDMIYDTEIHVPDIEGTQKSDAVFVNAENELYLLLSLKKYDAEKKAMVYAGTDLYRVNISEKEIIKLERLKSLQKSTVTCGLRDNEGRITLTAFENYGETSVVREKIVINEDKVFSEAKIINLPDNCSFDGKFLRSTATQYGIVLTGPTDQNDNMDNFLYDPANDSIVKLNKQIVPAGPMRTLVTEYKNRTYFLSIDMYSRDGATFAVADNDEFMGGSPHKDPLHYYGDDRFKDLRDLNITGKVNLITPGNGRVPIGKSIRISPDTTEKSGNKITYTWYSMDAMIAAVDQTGKVTGRIKGDTTICVTGRDNAGNVYEGRCPVTVYPLATGIKLSSKRLTVEGGDDIRLSAVLTPSEALTEGITWTVAVPSAYPGSIEKTSEVYDRSEGSTATFRTKDVDGNVQVKITASATDGSKKYATCNVTIIKRTPDKPAAPVKSAALSDIGTIYLGAGMKHEISLVRINPVECGEYSVSWMSSNDAVTVSGNEIDASRAVIKANKNGNAKITAVITNTAPGGKKTITIKGLTVKVGSSLVSGNKIRIYKNKTDITGSISGNRLEVRKNLSLKASVYSNNTPVKVNKTKILWSSSDPSVATATNGMIRTYKEGKVTFTATLVPTDSGQRTESVNASCTFYVYNPVKELSMDTTTVHGVMEIKAAAGDVDMMVLAMPQTTPVSKNDSVREEKTYAWSSSDPCVVDIAMIKENPAVVNLIFKKGGKAVITCKALDGSNKSVKCKVIVYERVKEIRITAKNLGTATVNTYNAKEIIVKGLKNKKTFTISPNIEPTTATNKQVVYSSSNPEAVKVNKNGQVKRYGAGNADIFVTTVDGGYSAICHVVE